MSWELSGNYCLYCWLGFFWWIIKIWSCMELLSCI